MSNKKIKLSKIAIAPGIDAVVLDKYVKLFGTPDMIKNISRERVIYVSGRYTGPTKAHRVINISRAELVSVALVEAGFTYHCPHMNTALLEAYPSLKYQIYMEMDMETIRRSDGICMIPEWDKSSGALTELALAQELNKGVIFAEFLNLDNYPCHPPEPIHRLPSKHYFYVTKG